jgi:hypothetical protein
LDSGRAPVEMPRPELVVYAATYILSTPVGQ